MKKYFKILKYEIKNSFQYLANMLYNYIGFLIHIFIFLNLWKYIYSDPSSLIKGYTFYEMIWYVIITETIWSSIAGRKIIKDISKSVKSGDIVYNLTKPINYILYNLFSHLGTIITKFIIYIIFAFITGYIFLGTFVNINILSLFLVLVTILLAILISLFTMIIIGEIAFFIEDANPIYWIYSKVVLIFGTIFPLELFSEPVRNILKYSPVYVTTYGPAKLFVHFNYYEFAKLFGFQLVYIFILYLFALFIFKKGVRKLNVFGG